VKDGDIMSEAEFVAIKTVVNRLASPPEEQWRRFGRFFHRRVLAAEEFFIRAGDTSKYLGFINSGMVRFYYQTAQGAQFNKSFSRANDFVGAYSAYLTGETSRFHIQALQETRMLVAAWDDICGLYDEHVCWQKLGRLFAEQLYIKKEQREAEFLLDDAETRYRHFLQRYPGLEDDLPQYHIAGYIGITAVALSRIRRKIKNGER